MDATVFEGKNKYGIGICIRDENGVYKGGKAMWFYGSPNPQETEAMDLVQALKFLNEKNLTLAVIEIDYLSIENGVNNYSTPKNELGVILSQYRTIITHCQSYKISYVRRQTNRVAHSLAQASKLYSSSHFHDLSTFIMK